MTRSLNSLFNKPKLITLEGTEGSGKSSFLIALQKCLKQKKIKSIFTREPGGARVAEKIRDVILSEKMNPMTELFLYEAARAEHLHSTILPALKKGAWVICDRFTDSSLAYQGTARGIDRTLIRELNKIATGGLEPSITLFLDIDPKAGLKSATNPNRFEREGVKFQEKVRRGFLKTIKEEPARFIVMKAKSGTPDEMANKFLDMILMKDLNHKKINTRKKKLNNPRLKKRIKKKESRS